MERLRTLGGPTIRMRTVFQEPQNEDRDSACQKNNLMKKKRGGEAMVAIKNRERVKKNPPFGSPTKKRRPKKENSTPTRRQF